MRLGWMGSPPSALRSVVGGLGARRQGQPCGWLQDGALWLSDGKAECALIAAADVPLTLGGAARYNIEKKDYSIVRGASSIVRETTYKTFTPRLGLRYKLSPAPVLVMADERLLRQILNNLVNNAIKFTPEGGAITVEATAPRPDVVAIAVRDTGIGMAPEKLAMLFKPFSQLDSSLSRKYGGTGLGLTLVDRLVRLHGGTVEGMSEPGRGSTFQVELPAGGVPKQTLTS